MRGPILMTFAVLAGCGDIPFAKEYVPSSGSVVRQYPAGFSASLPGYEIDSNVAASVPLDTFGITTNGRTWYLQWQSGPVSHRFQGEVFCPVDCSLLYRRLDTPSAGAKLELLSANHFRFEESTPAGMQERLEFDSTMTPVGISVLIDGESAVRPAVAFPSEGRLATAAAVPFLLFPNNVGMKTF